MELLDGSLQREIGHCRICADRFAATETRHGPRPVPWFDRGARLLIAGQAPGARVHDIGRPFADPSGDRLRAWLGVDEQIFYDRSKIAFVPMAFCFPGYDKKGSDLPPPGVCAETWRTQVLQQLADVRLTLLIGRYAQSWHLGLPKSERVSETVARWRDFAPATIPLPHPSWRNTAWLRRNPWFEEELLPVLRQRVKEVLGI
ncbi:MAG: uracil-DNA glycosylase family protein [Pseudomonadota bacterium]